MEQLKKMLEKKYPNINFNNEKKLVSDGFLDSLDVVEIIAEIEELFNISITMEYIQPTYFDSIESMWEMVVELQ